MLNLYTHRAEHALNHRNQCYKQKQRNNMCILQPMFELSKAPVAAAPAAVGVVAQESSNSMLRTWLGGFSQLSMAAVDLNELWISHRAAEPIYLLVLELSKWEMKR